MTRPMTFAASAVLFAMTGLAGAAPSPAGHHHDHHETMGFSAGEEGDAKEPARVIEVIMRESDGKMLFVPDRLEIRRGEQVRFVLRNIGELEHEFVLATTEENLKHAEAMRKRSDMEHTEPNARRVAPKKTSELDWKFTKAGQFEFACLITGHREAGMFGVLEVR